MTAFNKNRMNALDTNANVKQKPERKGTIGNLVYYLTAEEKAENE